MSRAAQSRRFRRESVPAGAGGADTAKKRTAAEASGQNGETTGPFRSAGEEVDAILETAREAGAKLVSAAKEEAERTRVEANAAATHEVERAHQQAETEREQAAKLRTEADAHATRVRDEAEAAAALLREDAKTQATSLVEAARAKVAAADAEVEQMMRKAEETARARIDALQVETRHHEERLEHLLAVLRAMESQVEAVLATEDGRDLEPADAVELADEDLAEALQPNARSRPVA